MCGDIGSMVATGLSFLGGEGPAAVSAGTGSLAGSGGSSGMPWGQLLQIGGQALQGGSALDAGNQNASALRSDADAERAAASRQAQLILKQSQRQRGAARAATAASGARVDEFSLMNEGEILQAGETDAAMALLSGDRRARVLEQQAKQQKQGGLMSGVSSLFKIATVGSNWKNVLGG